MRGQIFHVSILRNSHLKTCQVWSCLDVLTGHISKIPPTEFRYMMWTPILWKKMAKVQKGKKSWRVTFLGPISRKSHLKMCQDWSCLDVLTGHISKIPLTDFRYMMWTPILWKKKWPSPKGKKNPEGLFFKVTFKTLKTVFFKPLSWKMTLK